jgi:hypothetical protein
MSDNPVYSLLVTSAVHGAYAYCTVRSNPLPVAKALAQRLNREVTISTGADGICQIVTPWVPPKRKPRKQIPGTSRNELTRGYV